MITTMNPVATRAMRYLVRPTPLGYLVCAGTDRGVAAVRIGQDERELLDELSSDMPDVELVQNDSDVALGRAADLVIAAMKGDQVDFSSVTLDAGGSDFQRRVWSALAAIPAGEVRSYGEVAVTIGRPGASRAVGTACGANRFPVIVPCHRVVRGDGSLGGYRWGLDVKRALLAAEAQNRVNAA